MDKLESGALPKAVRAERRRQLQQIRQQELAYLRSLHDGTAANGSERPLEGFEAVAPPSHLVPLDTLKKIDEIEARMDQRWVDVNAKTRPAAATPSATLPAALQEAVAAVETASSQRARNLQTARIPPPAATQPVESSSLTTPWKSLQGPARDAGHEEITPPRPLADLMGDPVLTAAASDFAGGRTDEARQGLLVALRASPQRSAKVLCWLLALIETYRTSGNRAEFDGAVLEYFDYWDGATPTWHDWTASADEQIAPGSTNAHHAPVELFAPSVLDQMSVWRCPALLDAAAAHALIAHWQSVKQCAVDWYALNAIDATAAQQLSAALGPDMPAPAHVLFFDTPTLLSVLQQATPQGEAQCPRSLWHLRLAMLQLMHMRDAFDQAVSDYCMTFIEPAPIWQAGQARFDGDAGAWANHSGLQGAGPKQPHQPVLQLQGQLVGAQALGLPAKPGGSPGSVLPIACRRLVRMDPDSTGALVNWVSRAQAQSIEVCFKGVSLLVAAYWHHRGLHANAQVELRDGR